MGISILIEIIPRQVNKKLLKHKKISVLKLNSLGIYSHDITYFRCLKILRMSGFFWILCEANDFWFYINVFFFLYTFVFLYSANFYTEFDKMFLK